MIVEDAVGAGGEVRRGGMSWEVCFGGRDVAEAVRETGLVGVGGDVRRVCIRKVTYDNYRVCVDVDTWGLGYVGHRLCVEPGRVTKELCASAHGCFRHEREVPCGEYAELARALVALAKLATVEEVAKVVELLGQI